MSSDKQDRPLTPKEAKEFADIIEADDHRREFEFYKDSYSKLKLRCRELERYIKIMERFNEDRQKKLDKLEGTLEKLEGQLAKLGFFNV